MARAKVACEGGKMMLSAELAGKSGATVAEAVKMNAPAACSTQCRKWRSSDLPLDPRCPTEFNTASW
jgi:hypothetical protein